MQNSVVLTGISGRFPQSESVEELWNNLKSGEILYTPPLDRHPRRIRDQPKRIGKIKDLLKFDNEFFGQNEQDANDMGPQARLLYEVTYEALYDAGLDPKDLKGSRIAFFLGTSGGDGGYDAYDEAVKIPYLTYIQSRMSYHFDWRGPSFSVDTACAATIDNLVQAYYHLKYNLCDLVIVAGANTINDPFINRCLADLHLLSPTGFERCLDDNADGFIRSECVAAIVMQRKSDAKRIYGEILGASVNNDGYTEEGITFPNRYAQADAMRRALKESGVAPDKIDYVEAHITGTQAGDAVETSAIMDAFRDNNDKPLRLGCVKSNAGHGEATAGSIAFIKACKILQTNLITPNAAYEVPNSKIEDLAKGRIVPITEQSALNNDLLGVNTFGFGGSNGHVIMKRNMKEVEPLGRDDLVLFNLCNRTEYGLRITETYLRRNCNSISRDALTFMNHVSRRAPEDGLNHRCFVIMNRKGIVKSEKRKLESRRRLCLVIEAPKELPESDLLKVHFISEMIENGNQLNSKEKEMLKSLLNAKDASRKSAKEVDLVSLTLWQLVLIDFFKELGLEVDIVLALDDVRLGQYFCGKESKQAVLKSIKNGSQSAKLNNKKASNCQQNNNSSISKLLTLHKNDFIHFSATFDKQTIDKSEWTVVTLGSNLTVIDDDSSCNGNFGKLLETLGKLYLSGHSPDLSKVHRFAEFPVGRECPTISHLLQWNHLNKKFARVDYTIYANAMAGSAYKVDLSDPEFEEIGHHVFEDKVVMPAAGYLYLAWKHAAEVAYGAHKSYQNLAFKAWKVRFHQSVPITAGSIEFHVRYNPATKRFYITYNRTPCVSGYLELYEEPSFDFSYYLDGIESRLDVQEFSSDRFYLSCQVQGFRYGPKLRSIISSSVDVSYARVSYQGGFISLVDSMLQVAGLSSGRRHPRFPVSIDEFVYEPQILDEFIEEAIDSEAPILEISINKTLQTLTTSGVFLKGLNLMILPQRVEHPDLHYFHQEFLTYDYELLGRSKNNLMVDRYLAKCKRALYSPEELTVFLPDDAFSYDDEKKYSLFSFIKNYLSPSSKHESHSADQWNEILSGNGSALDSDFGIDSLITEVIQSFTNVLESEMCKKLVKAVVMGHDCDRLSNILATSLLKWAIATELSVQKKPLKKSMVNEKDTSDKKSKTDLFMFTDSSLSFLPTDENMIDFSEFQFEFQAVEEGKSLVVMLRDHVMLIEDILMEKMGKMYANLRDRSCKITQFVESLNFLKVSSCYHKESGIRVILFKKKIAQPLKKATFINIESASCKWVEDVQVAMEDPDINRVWLTATDFYSNGIIGFAKCVRFEPYGDKIRAILWPGHELDQNGPEMREIASRDMTINVNIDGKWGSFHQIGVELDEETLVAGYDCYVDSKRKGDFTSLSWFKETLREVDETTSAASEYEDVKVAYSALNFRDILLASGRLSADAYPPNNVDTLIGTEFSGKTESGKRVMGLCRGQGIATTIRRDNICALFDVPDCLSLEEAATIPNVYMTVYYALILRANLQKGETVLIHAGGGGVGQAAINLCLAMGCKVFTTVGSEEKKKFLQKRFPELDDSCFSNSRSCEFENHILRQTDSRGVDVVLNSLIEDKLQAGIRCLAPGGRFLELGKHDIVSDNNFDPVVMPENTSFNVICLSYVVSRICEGGPAGQALMKKFTDFIQSGLSNGQVRPIFSHTFGPKNVEDAFRFMAKSKHLGKVLIKVHDENDKTFSIPPSIKRTHFDPKKSYILVGGLGGMGQELAYWMVTRGAKNIIITSRSGFKNDSERAFIEYLRNYCDEHRNIVVSINDCITSRFVQQLLETANKIAPVGGIFNLAMVLNDGLFENQTQETFEKVCAPKVHITNNLDALSRKLCPQLDYFVCFSSISTLGSIGQSNYGFANSHMERLCEARRREGLPALSVQWGPVADVGVAARLAEEKDLNILGFVGQNIFSCFNALDKFMQTPYPVCQSCVISDEATSVPEFDDLFARMAHILGIKDFANLDPQTTLGELGLDSLQSAEMRQYFERQYDLPLGDKPIGNYKISDIKEIAERLTKKGAMKEVKLD